MEIMGEGDLLDPHPDIASLFCYYNGLYFQNTLGACSVQWSSARMTLCAGICKYSHGGGCEIRLSEPLLKYRPVSDLKNTLLHEMIHAFLFLTNGNKDHDDHGQYFLSKMKEINDSTLPDYERPPEGYHISVYHNFKDEVDNYRVHHWKCQSCGSLVKRAMNRPPSAADCVFRKASGGSCEHPRCLWHTHERTCGGIYLKIAEPPGYTDKRKKSIGSSKSGNDTKAAGKRKIDENASTKDGNGSKNIEHFFGKSRKLVEENHKADAFDLTSSEEEASRIMCPSCSKTFIGDIRNAQFNAEVNRHLDSCLSGIQD